MGAATNPYGTIDVIGVVKEVGELSSITSKATNKEVSMCSLDASSAHIFPDPEEGADRRG